MGTRAHVNFIERSKDKETILCSIYQHFDGYVKGGVGENLKDFLASKTLVDGMSGDRTHLANGIGCLTAQYIANFKHEAGNLYIIEPVKKHLKCVDNGISYCYNVFVDEKENITIEVHDYDEVVFSGSLDEYIVFVDTYETE